MTTLAYRNADNLGAALRTERSSTLAGQVKVWVPEQIQAVPLISDDLRAAVKAGWAATYAFLFDEPKRPFVGVLARHHRQAIKWHWAARHRVCRGGTPRYMADFPIFSRGHMKSTLARRLAVVDAIISLYYGIKGGYCLYFSGTDAKTEKHALSIEKLLRSERMRKHALLLTEVNRSDIGSRSLGWKATFFYTAAGYIYHFGSLQSGLAGGNVDDVRPTLLVPDDIDDRKDSPVIAETNFKLLTTEILPMGAQGTLTFWAQNLISRYSCMYRIYKGHARVLTNRRPSDPVPAILNLVTDVRTIDSNVRDIIVSGTPTWPYFDLEACQDEINRMGLPAFLREAQHEVEQSRQGLMIHTYDDAVHPISHSEFESIYGTRKMPKEWPKEWGNDWARTKTEKHANVALWRTVSSQGSPLPGFSFYFYPMSFPANAQPEDVAERVLSCLEEYATDPDDRRLAPQTADKPRLTWAELRRDELIRANALAHTTTQLERIEYERSVLQEIIPKYSESVMAKHNALGGVNSHEREDIRLIYNAVYALMCQGVNPGKFGGVEQINRDFQVDYDGQHPFRLEQKGFTRTFVVVPDDETQPARLAETVVNGERRTIAVYPPAPYPAELTPADLVDDRLFRYQMMNWRLQEPKITETGERIDDPLKMSDDYGNLCQMMAVTGLLLNTPLSVKEEFKMLVDSKVKPNAEGGYTIQSKSDQQNLEFARYDAERQLQEKYQVDNVFEEENDDGDEWWAQS